MATCRKVKRGLVSSTAAFVMFVLTSDAPWLSRQLCLLFLFGLLYLLMIGLPFPHSYALSTVHCVMSIMLFVDHGEVVLVIGHVSVLYCRITIY